MTVVIAKPQDTQSNLELTQLATLGKAMGDSLRLEVLRLLRTESLGVLELTRILDTRQSGLSHHLKVLSRAGLVSTRREGNSIFYRRALPPMDSAQGRLIQSFFEAIDEVPLAVKYRERLQEIRQARAEQSRVFFSRNIQAFRHHQELIADHDLYSRTVLEMLAHVDSLNRGTVLELGPGEGTFLPQLSEQFQRVIALDNSRDMLEQARAKAHKAGITNVEYRLGELSLLADEGMSVDCIIANMVLHHVPAPAAIFREAATLLRPGASLFISDLSRHDQEWVKDSCGDLWLGFSTDELSGWAREAGLVEGESQYLGLRNGFQIQVRQFYRQRRRQELLED
ncbi:ArsR/SmtB family transcription factor [Sansalvadorimonas verongulae]|uniref:ArsR/SmtB family transcription factor n=1 Tax=Sansalvadorimonas verongulae TaxID=2172824 RepID=UPI0012BBB7E5|nr:metalloregulator ArsR/SmtB family transcription factor [Sansalvadorimonas verongulae]MTI12159.1 metalloregulator ArsR/SmtB family transcription factor [Sansalvadorimonas verongulae]